MGWFSKGSAAPMIATADVTWYGRAKFGVTPVADFTRAGDLERRAFEWARADRAGFLTAMVAASATSGWAAYGAGRLQIEALGYCPGNPQFDAVMHASLDGLRARGIPRSYLTGYENQWWVQHAEGAPWITGRPAPEPHNAALTPLREGEMREIACMGPEGNNNTILATASGGVYRAVIAGSDDGRPDVVHTDWHSASTHYDLYLRVGEALTTPKPWIHPELEPFIPLPAPDLR